MCAKIPQKCDFRMRVVCEDKAIEKKDCCDACNGRGVLVMQVMVEGCYICMLLKWPSMVER
jgi:hypothetical protein